MDIEAARQQMIHQQVRAWDVLDPAVLEVLGRVPRERFVPAAFAALAFADTEIPLPAGQSMLAPKIHGRILQAVDLRAGETVLEVGAGSGYLTACLAALGGQVTTLEIEPELAKLATDNLRATGHTGVQVFGADATRYTPTQRFDAVVLTASLPEYDPRYADWLRIGGRMFAVVGDTEPMAALKITRAGERDFGRESLFETVVDPLVHARRPSRFVF
ncbi:MAG TPA: protein-L-isoaspartate O-methyltransferase [Steroidobacteraceae bacterium]|nr:protein-L-isoaspartate O-methyltransferase [Steroidobacteraceae bacterium]